MLISNLFLRKEKDVETNKHFNECLSLIHINITLQLNILDRSFFFFLVTAGDASVRHHHEAEQ